MARTRAEDFEAKRRGLLKSAAAVFAEQGMDKASMSRVARQAGVSKALLYHYYPGRDALILAIIRTHLEGLDAAVAAADDPALPPGERLRRLVRAVLETYRGADSEHKVQLNAIPALPEAERAEITAIERRIVRRLSEVLRAANPGLDRAERPLLMPVTMSLFGILNWVFLWFRDDGPVSREEFADLATTLMLEGIGGLG